MAATATLDYVQNTRPPVERASGTGIAPRTGRVLSGFVALFLVVDGGGRLAGFAPYVEGTIAVGFPAWTGTWIGLSLVIATLLYILPRTAVLGAVLVTGYLGGATATQVRLEDPWFLFPAALGVLAWLGLYLREDRLAALLPIRK